MYLCSFSKTVLVSCAAQGQLVELGQLQALDLKELTDVDDAPYLLRERPHIERCAWYNGPSCFSTAS